MNRWKLLLALLLFLPVCSDYALLDGLPVQFSLQGTASFTPNSGASVVSGYVLTVGYLNHGWIAIEIIGTTSDIIIVQQDPFYTVNSNSSFSGHIVTMKDYHLEGGSLTMDSNTNDDLNAIGYMKNRNVSLTVKRALSSHSGQDWDASRYRDGMTQVCFYTGAGSFDGTNWKGSTSSCSYYEIRNLISTFRGSYLKDIKMNGYPVSLYGYIDGPYVSSNVFFYHPTSLYTYNKPPAVILELGTASSSTTQDFNVFSLTAGESGDYFGSSVASMQLDTSANGFEDSGMSVTYENVNALSINSNITTTNVKIAFRRNISTYDPMDKQLLSTFTFCLYLYSQGSITGSLTDKYCDVVELSISYPRMVVPTRSFATRLALALLLAAFLLI